MTRKPSWGLWLTWLVAYSAFDLLLSAVLHGGLTWGQALHQAPAAIAGAVAAATLTWLWALRKWYKSDGF
jgi:hypothetical protein